MTSYATTYGDIIGYAGPADSIEDAVRRHYADIGFLDEIEDHSMKVAELTPAQMTAIDASCESNFRNGDDELSAVLASIRWTKLDDAAVRAIMTNA